MRFDTKIAIVVKDDLLVWQKLNVVSFLSGGIAGSSPEIVGKDYEDRSGNKYLPLIVQPIMVYVADESSLRKVFDRARNRGLKPAIYTMELFSTGNDEDNRASVKAFSAENLNIVGIAMRSLSKDVDKVLRGIALHP